MNKREDMAGREGETDGQMRKGNGHELWIMERTLQQSNQTEAANGKGGILLLSQLCVCVAMFCRRQYNVCMKW